MLKINFRLRSFFVLLIAVSYSFIASGNPANLIINIKTYGAKGDGKTNDRGAFAKAFAAINEKGGGKLFLPRGTYYIDAPIIVNSNTILEGEGINTIILNSQKGSPWGNCIHVGYGREFSDWGGTYGKITDATFEQFDNGNYSNITTRNVTIRNLRTKSTNIAEGGLGIFVLNAQNILIENITGDGNATPVNIGNDSDGLNAACRNVKVRNIKNINPGRWYDLVFIGMAENVEVYNCTYKYSKSSLLNEIITIGGRRCKVFNNHIERISSSADTKPKKAIDVTSPRFGTIGDNIVEDNVIINIPVGITIYNSDKNLVRRNKLQKNETALRIYSRNNQVAKNTFNSNRIPIILETDAARGEISGNSGLDLNRIVDKFKLLGTYKK